MLSRKIPKLKLDLKSKGRSRYILLHKYLLPGIPVLSIFALMGIVSYAIGINLFNNSEAVNAIELSCNNTADASLSIDGLADNTASDAGYGKISYRNYKISAITCNANDYNLTIAGPNTMNGNTDITSVDGNLQDNEWGYYYGSEDITGQNNPTFNKLDGENSPKRLEYNTGDINSTKNLTFAVKFGNTASLGHYTAKVNLSLVITPKATVYTLTYHPNGGAGVPNQQSCTVELGNTSCIINTSTVRPTRAGYSFQGWSTSSSAGNASNQPGDSLTMSGNLTLYAVWKAVTGFNGITQMQQMTSNVCNQASIGTAGQLYDTRDNNDYTIAKLADGKCWMTQNLRLADHTVTLVSNATGQEISTKYAIPSVGTWSGSSGAIEGLYYDNNPANGAYYTWYTITGKTGTAAITSGDAPASICPAGWTLPKGGSTGQYQSLYNKYNSNQMASDQRILLGAASATAGGAYFPAVGMVINNKLDSLGVEGSYWTRTADSDTNIYYLYFSKNTVSADFTYRNRDWAFPVRCVAYSTVADLNSISTMQEMTPDICSNTNIGTSKTLTDTRDSSSYSVRKLADGKCWMTQNLRITGRSVNLVDSTTGQETGNYYSIPSSSTWYGTTNTTEGAYYPGNTTNGAYYTWYTAVGKTSGTATICPKGWTMPTANYNGNFYNLYNKYSANQVTSNGRILLGASTEAAGGTYFPATGYVLNGSLIGTGTDGNYWSRTTAGNYIWRLGFNSSTIDYNSYAGAESYYGFPIRCISI